MAKSHATFSAAVMAVAAIAALGLGVAPAPAQGMSLGPWGYAACVTACEAGCATSCVVAGPVCVACFDKCFVACTPACYSNETRVYRRRGDGDAESVLVSDVRAGDSVLTLPDDADASNNRAAPSPIWTEVASNTQFTSKGGFDFVHVRTTAGLDLHVTVDHVLAVATGSDGDDSAMATKRAMHLRVGDVLLTSDGRDSVASVSRTVRGDKFNLVTRAGTVLASTSTAAAAAARGGHGASPANPLGIFTPTLCNAGGDAPSGDGEATLKGQLQQWREHHNGKPSLDE